VAAPLRRGAQIGVDERALEDATVHSDSDHPSRLPDSQSLTSILSWKRHCRRFSVWHFHTDPSTTLTGSCAGTTPRQGCTAPLSRVLRRVAKSKSHVANLKVAGRRLVNPRIQRRRTCRGRGTSVRFS
jgi:hypothetical protein